MSYFCVKKDAEKGDRHLIVLYNPEKYVRDESMYYKRHSEGLNWGDYLYKEWNKNTITLPLIPSYEEVVTVMRLLSEKSETEEEIGVKLKSGIEVDFLTILEYDSFKFSTFKDPYSDMEFQDTNTDYKPTHNEEIFRNFIRANQMTEKWHEYIAQNPLEGVKANKTDQKMEEKDWGVGMTTADKIRVISETPELLNAVRLLKAVFDEIGLKNYITLEYEFEKDAKYEISFIQKTPDDTKDKKPINLSDVKLVFVIDGKEDSAEYTLSEIIQDGMDELAIIEKMEECTCSLNESNNHCDGSCITYENSTITGVKLVLPEHSMKMTEEQLTSELSESMLYAWNEPDGVQSCISVAVDIAEKYHSLKSEEDRGRIRELERDLRRADAVISELDSDLKKLSWIRVKDQLPEPNIQVLVFDGSIQGVASFTGKFNKPKLKKEPIWEDTTGYYSPLGDIDAYTHWKPLGNNPV